MLRLWADQELINPGVVWLTTVLKSKFSAHSTLNDAKSTWGRFRTHVFSLWLWQRQKMIFIILDFRTEF